MGLTYAEIELISEDDLALVRRGYLAADQVRKVKTSALVDSGATMLSISEAVRAQLGLQKLGEGEVELADGAIAHLDIVGPIEVRFENRRTVVEALVTPNADEVLLGVIPMEGMDVVIDPKQQRLIVNPKSPGKARLLLKGFRSL